MSCNKPSLTQAFIDTGDMRVLVDLIGKYKYTDEEASEVINIYAPYENGHIPEVEHIEVLLSHFPNSHITPETLHAIKCSFPNELKYQEPTVPRWYLPRSNASLRDA